MADHSKCPKCGMFGGTHKKECRVLAYLKEIGLDSPKEEPAPPAVTRTIRQGQMEIKFKNLSLSFSRDSGMWLVRPDGEGMGFHEQSFFSWLMFKHDTLDTNMSLDDLFELFFKEEM